MPPPTLEECFGVSVRTYTISLSAAVVPRSNCERRRRCSSRYCWPTRGANKPMEYNIGLMIFYTAPGYHTNRHAQHSRYCDAFLMDYLVPGSDPQCQQEVRCRYEKSGSQVSVSLSMSLRIHQTFGRKDGCSSMTELFRNFCTRQSFPWIAIQSSDDYIFLVDSGWLTGVWYFSNFVAIEAIPVGPY